MSTDTAIDEIDRGEMEAEEQVGPPEDEVMEESLIEEVSIDGMCGVY